MFRIMWKSRKRRKQNWSREAASFQADGSKVQLLSEPAPKQSPWGEWVQLQRFVLHHTWRTGKASSRDPIKTDKPQLQLQYYNEQLSSLNRVSKTYFRSVFSRRTVILINVSSTSHDLQTLGTFISRAQKPKEDSMTGTRWITQRKTNSMVCNQGQRCGRFILISL